MNRWRDIKAGKKEPLNEESKNNNLNSNICTSIPARIKAFIVDMFMIMMPLAYATTYVFMNGKDDFQGSQEARWGLSIIYGLIIIVFWIAKGQTPGLKAYSLKLIDEKTREKISFPKAILRYLSFIFAATTIVLTFLPFFRKDKKTFQDLVTNTLVIKIQKK
ncbi:RDD domain containing protein [Arcobacter nitrofigilis DSM 7299]|uniref:RDD domain containing protein n=1 Tax=Arcobacter nitrofigilis (strain ATCC 33309 / DSM 7299 / CCUG 15893 / LMG 7604 / NCTC 12251 / CI) TaxID=572480 RepID=D5V7T3_ARCNC|nr:RDD family protein [Arcobacter nitrofigilis]ADG94703.1 RDD domain containing protein [Arcobacter nitrofigilis DSM 7299]